MWSFAAFAAAVIFASSGSHVARSQHLLSFLFHTYGRAPYNPYRAATATRVRRPLSVWDAAPRIDAIHPSSVRGRTDKIDISALRRSTLGEYSRHAAGQSVNKEYLSQTQFYSIFSELPVLSNTVVIITVFVKVANSTF